MCSIRRQLPPGDPRDLADPVAFALRSEGRRRVHNSDEYMVAIAAERFKPQRDDADDAAKRDAERAEAERLRDEGKPVVSIGGKLIEPGANPESSSKD